MHVEEGAVRRGVSGREGSGRLVVGGPMRASRSQLGADADGPPHFSGPASQQGRRLELLRSSMYLRQ